jgi:beta-glucosidase
MKLQIAAASVLLIVIGEATTDSKKTPIYKNPNVSVDARVADLLSRMTIQDKTSQLVQGDIGNWMSPTTGAFNATGLEWNMAIRGGSFYVGYPVA